MKHLKYIVFGIAILSGISLLLGCSSEEASIDDVKTSSVSTLYADAYIQGATFNTEAMEVLGANPTRNGEEESVVEYLLAQPMEKLDSIYSSLGGESQVEVNDSIFTLSLDRLSQVAPPEEIAKLFSFMDTYVSEGGHSINLIQNEIRGLSTPLIQDIAIHSAALYDNIFPSELPDNAIESTRSLNPCVLQLAIDCGGIAVGVMSTSLAFASQDYGFAIIDCCHDVVDVVSAIRRYKRCEYLESWRNY